MEWKGSGRKRWVVGFGGTEGEEQDFHGYGSRDQGFRTRNVTRKRRMVNGVLRHSDLGQQALLWALSCRRLFVCLLNAVCNGASVIIQGIHKRMVRFQNVTRNLFLTFHGHNVHLQQRKLSKFLMRYQQFASHANAGPRDQFPRWRRSRKRLSVCSVLCPDLWLQCSVSFVHGASFLNRARNSRCSVITDLDAWCVFSKPCTKLTLHCNHRSGHKTEHTESLFLLRRHLGNWPPSRPRIKHEKRTAGSAWETWTVSFADGVCCSRVRWEISLLTFETAPFFCVCPVETVLSGGVGRDLEGSGHCLGSEELSETNRTSMATVLGIKVRTRNVTRKRRMVKGVVLCVTVTWDNRHVCGPAWLCLFWCSVKGKWLPLLIASRDVETC